MNISSQDKASSTRLYFLDNLRTFMIFLVVVYHAGLVYESSGVGATFWIVDDPSTNNLTGILNLVLEIFIMPTIFFVSGFFTPQSVSSKTAAEFLGSKFKRLIIPWAVAVLTLIPIYKVIFLYSRGLPQEEWTSYFHFSNGSFSQLWLWFLPILFFFNLAYLALTKARLDMSRLGMKPAVAAVFLVGLAYSFGMRMLDGHGWTKTPVIDFENQRLLIYFLMFLLGSVCYQLKIFESAPARTRLYNIVNWTSWIPICLYIFLIIYTFVKPNDPIISVPLDQFFIRLSYHLSLLAMLYTMVTTFRLYFHKQGAFAMELNRNSYYVYIIHVVVMGGIALLLLETTIHSLLKFLILVTATYVAANLLISLVRKIRQVASGPAVA
jgi:fucose 4-O-acetylase-like acetyltransferase